MKKTMAGKAVWNKNRKGESEMDWEKGDLVWSYLPLIPPEGE